MPKIIKLTAEDGTESFYGPYYAFNSFHRAWDQLLFLGWEENDLQECELQKPESVSKKWLHEEG